MLLHSSPQLVPLSCCSSNPLRSVQAPHNCGRRQWPFLFFPSLDSFLFCQILLSPIESSLCRHFFHEPLPSDFPFPFSFPLHFPLFLDLLLPPFLPLLPREFHIEGFSAGSYTGAVIALARRALFPECRTSAKLGAIAMPKGILAALLDAAYPGPCDTPHPCGGRHSV